MFTGLIQEVGLLRGQRPENEGARLRIEARFAGDLVHGESVAIDGACLTVEAQDSQGFTVFTSEETLRRTTLGSLPPGAPVNLERALAVGERLGGHWVQGHVDATGTLVEITPHGESRMLTFTAPETVMKYLVEKGSVAVDGISLTLAGLAEDRFSVWIIPETWVGTTLGRKSPGDRVNLECDLIAKYVFRYLEGQRGEGANPSARDAALSDLLRQGGWAARGPFKGE